MAADRWQQIQGDTSVVDPDRFAECRGRRAFYGGNVNVWVRSSNGPPVGLAVGPPSGPWLGCRIDARAAKRVGRASGGWPRTRVCARDSRIGEMVEERSFARWRCYPALDDAAAGTAGQLDDPVRS
ncbi:hypothetical protein LSH36_209g03016 [Paralvinella palmiformis]|uniref:Uncharacterized protein n=1 Tax=Paralvinella palmiformis TaxID=53620 RepID=A0AAD9N5W3_9ANNE|nr:hypothetical protein LSH36_209g03016 [Paralvinella palmiformis]